METHTAAAQQLCVCVVICVCVCWGDNETGGVKEVDVCFYVLLGERVTIRATSGRHLVKVKEQPSPN